MNLTNLLKQIKIVETDSVSIAVSILSVIFNQLSQCVNHDKFSCYESILSMITMLYMSEIFLPKSH